MKSIYAMVAVIVAAELGYVVHRLSESESDACDLHEVGRASFCPRCRLVDSPLDSDGTCCGVRPRRIDVCIKACFVCDTCGRRRDGDAPCCPGSQILRIEVKSPLVFCCEGCGATAEAEGPCGQAACRVAGFKIRRRCADSGRWPHGGELARH